ncbi:MAG: hypothetical protein ACREIC_10095, partial [Limisphaerales bacterium]
MKTIPAFSTRRPHAFLRCNKFQTLLVLAAAALLVVTDQARASTNLLVNQDFEQPPSGQTVPTAWTYFAPPTLRAGVRDYWVVNTNTVGCSHMAPESGAYYWKQWGALYGTAPTNNVAGIYQTFSSSPGSVYQANGWLAGSSCDPLGPDCMTWLQVEFLDSNTNLIALYKSAPFSLSLGADTWFQFPVTNACDLSQPIPTGDPFFNTYAETGSVSQMVAPLGTVSVLFRYCYLQSGSEGGSAFVDDAALDQISGPLPPVISDLFPQNMIFVNPTNGLSFNASSPSGFTINNSAIHVSLNGTDVSASLQISGSASSKNVAYYGLHSNSTYSVAITVTDVANLTVSKSTTFQTMWLGVQAPSYLWEAEDWDFTNGM